VGVVLQAQSILFTESHCVEHTRFGLIFLTEHPYYRSNMYDKLF